LGQILIGDKKALKALISVLDSSDPSKYISEIKEIIGYDLFYTFDALIGTPDYKSEMLLGEEGLPLTTVDLIEIGLFVIDGKNVALAPEIKKVVVAKKLKFERLLERLQAKADRQSKNKILGE
jgi:hypothetical protein